MNEIISKKIKNLKVLVIGDIILDKYYYTKVNRISPEAPIPIAKYEKQESILGGAANVAKNLSRLGCITYLIGQVGNDLEGKEIENLLKEEKITFKKIEIEENTISKIRIISKGNQLLRLDFEKTNIKINTNKIISYVDEIKGIIDMVIVSDYQKGIVTKELINYLKNLNKYIAIDTKPGNFQDFENFSLIKPNFKEAIGIARTLGDDSIYTNTNKDIEKLGIFLKKRLKANILITRSEKGASYIGKEISHSKTEVSEVVDVTGAGDTSLAVFSVLDFLNIKKEEALKIMNVAAKITVSHIGTYSPNLEDIKKELLFEDITNIIPYNDIESVSNKLKDNKKKIVFTNGCFDLIHKGHISYLNKAKKFGDILIVGINSDKSVRKLKGKKRPIIDEESRAFVLSNLKAVDYVVIFEEDDPRLLIEKVKPNIHVKGGDYKKDEMIETKTVEKYGGKVLIIKSGCEYSTTKIESKIKNA